MKRVYFSKPQDAYLFACEKRAEGCFVEILHQNAGHLWGEACGVAVLYSTENVDRIESIQMTEYRSPFQLPNIISVAAWYFVISGILLLGLFAVLHPLIAGQALLIGISFVLIGFITLPACATTIEKLRRHSLSATGESRRRFSKLFNTATVVLMAICIQYFCVSDTEKDQWNRKSALGANPTWQADSWDSWNNYPEGMRTL